MQTPSQDFTAATGTEDLPPEWDLSAYYTGPEDPRIDADLIRANDMAEDFASRYKGRVATLTGDELAAAIDAYDAVVDAMESVRGYGELLQAHDSAQYGKLANRIDDKLTLPENATTFFKLEIAQMDDARMAAVSDAPALSPYLTWIDRQRAEKAHLLGEAEERIINTMNQTGREAWIKLYTDNMSSKRYMLGDESVTMPKILSVILNDDDPAVRRAAYESFGTVLKDNIALNTAITNTLAQDKAQSDRMRGYTGIMDARNLSNNIEGEIVNAMTAAVVDAYPRTTHRYYDLKRRQLGFDTLHAYDRGCPIVADVPSAPLSFRHAIDFVHESYASFSPEMAAILRKLADNRWIGANPAPNKRAGAFAHYGSTSKHPTLFMSWTGVFGDMFILAHELGHNIHQYLAAQSTGKNILMDTPLTLAETASIFGERITFERALAATTDPVQRQLLLAGKIEGTIATTSRQIAFLEFEKGVHTKFRESGALSSEELGDIWMRTQQASYGPAFSFDDSYANQWSYIPHFVRSPFYVYAYAFGECLVSSLYETYAALPEAEKPAFVEKYIDLLKAGGTKHHTDALAPFGIDLRDPAFWQRGMNSLARMIDRLEAEMTANPAAKPAAKPAGPRP